MLYLRLKISVLIVFLFVLLVAIASLRARASLGVTVFFLLTLGLNIASLILIATDLDDRIRISAVAYAVGGWGWLLVVTFVPAVDLFFRTELITPELIVRIVTGPNPNPPNPDRAIIQANLLVHSLLSIVLATLGAWITWKLTDRSVDPEPSTTPTTGQP